MKKTLLWISPAVLLTVIINPNANIDALIIGTYLLLVGHVYLQEKLLLAFLLIRPTLDQWRDVTLLTYHSYALNLNAALSILFLLWGSFMLWREHGTWNMEHGTRHWRPPLFFLFSFFLFLCTASILWSVAPSETLVETIKLANLALFFWLGYLFVKHDTITMRELIGAIWLSAALPIAAGIIQLFSGTGLATFDLRGRIYGTLAHPNVFAFLLLSLIIISTKQHINTTTQQQHKNLKSKIANLKYIALIILLAFTYSRAAIIGLVIFFLLIGAFRYRRLFSYLTIGLIVFYLIFFPLNAILLDHYNINLQRVPLIGRLTGRNEDADSLAWRQSVLRQTLPLISARPYLGWGFGTFPAVWTDNRSLSHQWDDSAESHNDYLRIILELGFTGLFAYLALLVTLLMYSVDYKTIQHRFRAAAAGFRIDSALPAWILVFAIVSLSDNMLHHTPVLWLTFAYWGAALGTNVRNLSVTGTIQQYKI